MSYTTDDVQRLFKLLGQTVWYTQHLELVMTEYNSLMSLHSNHEPGERTSEADTSKVLSKTEKETLEPLFLSLKAQGILPDRLEDRFRFFIKTRSWILHDCVNDNHLSFKDPKSQNFIFGLFKEYIKEAKALKAEIFKEMEAWLQQKGYDLDQVYQLGGKS